MPFKKGQSGNLNGRKKGIPNKVTIEMRENISKFLSNNFQRLENDFELLSPRERIKYYCDLLQYGLPKLQTVKLDSDFDKMSDFELDKIIKELKVHLDESNP